MNWRKTLPLGCADTAEQRAAWAEIERLGKTLRLDKPWPLVDTVVILARAAKHLLDDHDCDLHGHEEVRSAIEAAEEWAAKAAEEKPHA
jgi:hypothetical protein